MDGYTISEMARLASVSPKRILDWETYRYIKPLLAKKGKRLVRFYPSALADKICKAAALVAQGYKVAAAFSMAEQRPQQPTVEQPPCR